MTIKPEVTPKKILLVDDSPLILERLMSMLQELKIHSLFCCGTAHEARQFFTHMAPDFVVLDINLPDGSGIDLLEMAKKLHPNACVVMLTNQSGSYYRKLCHTLGADHYLDKSTDFELIPDLIAGMATVD